MLDFTCVLTGRRSKARYSRQGRFSQPCRSSIRLPLQIPRSRQRHPTNLGIVGRRPLVANIKSDAWFPFAPDATRFSNAPKAAHSQSIGICRDGPTSDFAPLHHRNAMITYSRNCHRLRPSKEFMTLGSSLILDRTLV